MPTERLEKIAFYILLATVVLTPLLFWPSQYVAVDLVKTIAIALGSLASAIIYGVIAIQERQLRLPPRSLVWTSALIALSLIISAFSSLQSAKSLFGQGFESGTAAFVIILFVAALAAFTAIARRPERAIILYAGMVAAYLILALFHALRLALGPGFMSFSILSSVTSTVIGSWYGLGVYSFVVALVGLLALIYLPLSRAMKTAYVVLVIIAAAGAFIINDPRAWIAAVPVFAILTIYMSLRRARSNAAMPFSGTSGRILRSLAWVPLVACLVAALFVWKSSAIAGPVISKVNAGYQELTLPWQMTLDVTAGAVKNFPLFGVGPNHFLQAFLAFKPDVINPTPAWSVEFPTGFGYVPTFIATTGLVGAALWVLFFVFFGIASVRALKRLPDDHTASFIVMSSWSASVFLWLMLMISSPSHAILLLAFVMTGIFFGSAVAYGLLEGVAWGRESRRFGRAFTPVMAICLIIAAFFLVTYARKTVAMAYFGSGVRELTSVGNTEAADSRFAKALAFDTSDIYWQARAEAMLSRATNLASTVNQNTPASTSQAIVTQVTGLVNQGFADAQNAIAYDQSNYYNYLSQARIAELATNLRMDKGYDTAVAAYNTAISMNPHNPSLYLNLSRFQASQNKLDDALRAAGAALQTKNNYLDAVFLLSQIYAAKGDLANAIIAGQVATQLNPQNPLLYFQLGLLHYNNKNYSAASTAMAQAVKLQPDYANARYFLGLSDVRLGNTDDAIVQFTELRRTNPDNQEVALILGNLQAGKPIFADAIPPVVSPEKRTSLPIKQK